MISFKLTVFSRRKIKQGMAEHNKTAITSYVVPNFGRSHVHTIKAESNFSMSCAK